MTGEYFRVALPDERPAQDTTICAYVITAPWAHPLWSQYALYVIGLQDVDGVAPAHHKFDGTTHELLVVALNPDHTWTQATAEQQARDLKPLPYLTPVNICEQYIATDAEMVELAGLCAAGCAAGVLNPETSDAPNYVRANWLISTTKTLAHIRGEVHAP